MNRIGKFARVAVLSAYLSATIMIPSASAQVPPPPAGTVSFIEGYASGVNAAAPMFQRKIKSYGTQAPAAGWNYSSSRTKYVNAAGGTVPSDAPLDHKEGTLGTLFVVTGGTLIMEQVQAISTGAGTYSVTIEVTYTKTVDMMVTHSNVSSPPKSVPIT